LKGSSVKASRKTIIELLRVRAQTDENKRTGDFMLLNAAADMLEEKSLWPSWLRFKKEKS
jgi:hypothetical protein